MKVIRDFTIRKYTEIMESFLDRGYSFQTLEQFMEQPLNRVVILRHDVDKNPPNSLITAKLEHSKNISGTYYFRILKQSNDPVIIRQIVALGHEIGYHYEDMTLAAGNKKEAIDSFQKNLDYFRAFYNIRTICMHGSPSSKWDNREIWDSYTYKDYGIIGEPYYDLDYSRILYLTDTGRKWNGHRVSVRDKVHQENFIHVKEKIRTSDDILSALKNDELPSQILITVHPQRWSDNIADWVLEFGMQNIKNCIKKIYYVKQ